MIHSDWKQLLSMPKIKDGKFAYMDMAFTTVFPMEDGTEADEYFENQANMPKELELRVIWECPTATVMLVFWKGEFIGLMKTKHESIDFSHPTIVIIDDWIRMMAFFYKKAVKEYPSIISELCVCDMNSDKVIFGDDEVPFEVQFKDQDE